MGIIKKPVVIIEKKIDGNTTTQTIKYVDLSYITKLAKSKPEAISEIIEAYLRQTPALVSTMKESLKNKDWHTLKSTVHKMMPSFNIMGINKEFEQIAVQIQDYAHKLEQSTELDALVLQLGNVCDNACVELENELKLLKLQK